jgi:hypothetical protein
MYTKCGDFPGQKGNPLLIHRYVTGDDGLEKAPSAYLRPSEYLRPFVNSLLAHTVAAILNCNLT